MNSFSPISDNTEAPGLVAWLESTRIRVPLKGVECRFEITGGLASVELDQIFYQDNREALDCTYTFPLPASAAVYRCEMHVNGRVIRAKVEEREEAQRIYQRKKKDGQRAALVETERGNLFTLSLGNLQPGDLVIIRFAFFQQLERVDREMTLRVPLCPGVRYVPGLPLLRSLRGQGTSTDTDQVPDASRVSPPRIDELHPDAAYFHLEGSIEKTDAVEPSLSSPSHMLTVTQTTATYQIALQTNGTVPDRDLILRYEEPVSLALLPRAWSVPYEGYVYGLVELCAPAEEGSDDEIGQDFYFLVDRSGSMTGVKWQGSCTGVTAFVGLLGAKNRVDITLFESAFQTFAEKPLSPGEIIRDPHFQRLVSLGTGGGTELLPALKHVLARIQQYSTAAQRSARIILITDGQVSNEAEILSVMAGRKDVPVYAFGIDTAVNDAFLQSLARTTGGNCTLRAPNDDIAGVVSRLGARLRSPVLTDVKAEGAWEEASSQRMSVYGGDSVRIALRVRAGTAGPVRLVGKRRNGELQTFEFNPVPVTNAAVPIIWIRNKITELLDLKDTTAAIAYAKQRNLLCEGAAFIAWDESEKVAIATGKLYQPAQAPATAFVVNSNYECFEGLAAPRQLQCFEGFFDEAFVGLTSRQGLVSRLRESSDARDTAFDVASLWRFALVVLRVEMILWSELKCWFAGLAKEKQLPFIREVLKQATKGDVRYSKKRSRAEIVRLLSDAIKAVFVAESERLAAEAGLQKLFAALPNP